MQDEGCTNAYVISDTEVYGRGMAANVARIAGERGLAILANETLDPSPANVRAAAKRVAAANAACFFFAGFTQNNAVGAFKAVAAGSPDIKLFGPDGVAETAFTDELGPALEQRVYITNPTLGRRAYPPRGQKFFADFRAKYGRYPEPYAIYGYEAMSVLLSSIRQAGVARADAKGRRAVVDAFFDQTRRRSVLGTYDIDRYGDTTLADFGGFKAAGGRLVFHRRIVAAP